MIFTSKFYVQALAQYIYKCAFEHRSLDDIKNAKNGGKNIQGGSIKIALDGFKGTKKEIICEYPP